MNANFKILILLSIIIFLGCKNEIDTSFLNEQLLGFTKIDGYGLFESVINLSDGNIVIAGVKEDIERIELLKIDSEANQIWAKNYFEVNTNQMDMTSKRDGGMAIMGQKASNILISSIDGAGNELWTNSIPTENNYRGGDIIQTHDDGFLVLRSRFSSEGTQLVMIRFDKDGNEIWNETIKRTLDSEGYNVMETAQREYLISAKELTPPTANLVLLRVSQKGKILQEISLEQTVSSEPASLKTIETMDNGLVIINTTAEGNSVFGKRTLTISKIDMDGSYQWLKEINLGEDSFAKDITQLANGDLIVLGSIKYENEKSEIFLIKLDKQGNEVWQRTYEAKNNYYGNEIVETAKGFMVVGYSTPSNIANPSAIIMQVDDEGNPI